MPHTSTLLGFALISLGIVLTPGPNMIYLISRSLTQGPAAGIVSLGGVALGFVFYMLCAAFGITALLFAVPYAYDALRFAGAAYLLWLAWQAIRPNGRSPFQVKKLQVDGPRKLFAMGSSPICSIRRSRCCIWRCCRSSSIPRSAACLRSHWCWVRSRPSSVSASTR
jgi:threonine/homoserine/homoserine lactone efflux protein